MTFPELTSALPSLGEAGTLPSRFHDLLESIIIDGTLQPGERIHVEALAAHYGVSRIPIREALRSLHAAGWVEIRPHYGVRVRDRTEEELTELFEFRSVVEGRVARWAAERRSPQELAALAEAIDASLRARGASEKEIMAHSSRFYARLREAAHNGVLASTSAELEKRARFYFSTVAGRLGDDWLMVHQELGRLVAEGSADAAARVAERHIAQTGRAVRTLLFPAAVEA